MLRLKIENAYSAEKTTTTSCGIRETATTQCGIRETATMQCGIRETAPMQNFVLWLFLNNHNAC